MSQRYFALITIIVVGLLFNSEVFAQSGYVAPKRIVTLKITQVTPADQPWCDDWDFYIKSSIGGQQMPTLEVPFSFEGTHCGAFAYSAENFDNLFVSWQEMLACDLSPIEITIQLFERDGAFDGDDAEARTTFTVDPQAETPIADCYDQGSDGGFCYEVTIVGSTLSDQDGDGLPDEWELYGFDANCDGEITSGEDLLLPQMGANPNHKDLFTEVNWFEGYAPTAATLQAVKDAFGRAPVTAGGVRNPDDQEGITIHFDAGPVMNDVGFYGQGGRTLGPASQSPRSVADLHALMDQVEDVKRRGIFRQVVYGPIMEDGYPLPWAGQFVGNDRIQVENDSASTLMHELGHAVGLLHGGELAATDPWRVHGHNPEFRSIS